MWATVASANHRAFDRANELILGRKKNLDAEFVLGPHRCLSFHLARASMHVANEKWLRAIPQLRREADDVLMERSAGSMPRPKGAPMAVD